MATTAFLLPSTPGTYAVILESQVCRAIRIGRLGQMRLERGFYVYVGSAFGSGGLRARIAHHGRRARRPRWHIDYLRLHAAPCRVWLSGEAREHQWMAAIASMPGASAPMRGFGSSDCHCASHLLFFTHRPPLKEFRRRLRLLDPEHPPVRVLAVRAG